MKKYLIIFPVILFSLAAAPAFATLTISASPNPVDSGSEGAVSIVFPTPSFGGNLIYLYDNSGNRVTAQNGIHGTSPTSWSTAALPTSLAPGVYQIVVLDYNNGAVGDTYCSSGNSYGTCQATFSNGGASDWGTYSITVQAAPTSSPATGIAPINDTSSTASIGETVYGEMVALPLFIFKNYETQLVWLAIAIALMTSMFAIGKVLNLL